VCGCQKFRHQEGHASSLFCIASGSTVPSSNGARRKHHSLTLVPQAIFVAGRAQKLENSKRGDRYVRRLLIHGARSYVVHGSLSQKFACTTRLLWGARRPIAWVIIIRLELSPNVSIWRLPHNFRLSDCEAGGMTKRCSFGRLGGAGQPSLAAIFRRPQNIHRAKPETPHPGHVALAE
jgi:hypothetical protein